MSEMTEFDVESSVSRIDFVFVLSTKADVKYLLNIYAISLGCQQLVLYVLFPWRRALGCYVSWSLS